MTSRVQLLSNPVVTSTFLGLLINPAVHGHGFPPFVAMVGPTYHPPPTTSCPSSLPHDHAQ